MAGRHVDTLFGEAADRRLSENARRRFDDHLAACSACADAFADHCAARDALRAMPMARMVVPVRLPAHAPRAAGGPLAVLLSTAPGRLTWVAAGGLAAAAAALVVSLSLHSRTADQSGSALQAPVAAASSASSGAAADGAAAPARGTGPSAAAAGAGAVQPGVALPSAPPGAAFAQAAGPPLGYSNRVDVSTRRGETLVVATPSRTYAPGDQVTVYAGLLLVAPGAPARDTGVVPEVELRSAGPAPASGASPPPGGSLIALATPGPPGIYTLAIPVTAIPGDTLVIVAGVPAGRPSAADTTPITAQLTITVR